MYTYLNQRYGLKPLIVEHASAIVKAVNKCSPIDNDVAVFGQILRNEVDEEFRFVQQQLKQTVAELLRVYLKGKHPLKTDGDIGLQVRCDLTPSVRLRSSGVFWGQPGYLPTCLSTGSSDHILEPPCHDLT